jgi:tRNA G10  N-methylase Trm11
MHRRGYDVTSTDIADHGFGAAGVDFLSCQAVPDGCRAIVTNPPYGEARSLKGQEKSSMAMLGFVRHALRLTEHVQGQLALLVRFQWVAGKRASALMSAGPFAAVVALTRRIHWFEEGANVNISQHHHAWVVFDHAHPVGQPPALLFAD